MGLLEPFCVCGVRALGMQPGLGRWGGGGGCSVKIEGVAGRGELAGTCRAPKVRAPALLWCLESVYLKRQASACQEVHVSPSPVAFPSCCPTFQEAASVCSTGFFSHLFFLLK